MTRAFTCPEAAPEGGVTMDGSESSVSMVERSWPVCLGRVRGGGTPGRDSGWDGCLPCACEASLPSPGWLSQVEVVRLPVRWLGLVSAIIHSGTSPDGGSGRGAVAFSR